MKKNQPNSQEKIKILERELANSEEKIAYMAGHDYLTNLPNKFLFKEILNKTISRLKRNKQNMYAAVLFLDIDGFKTVNDSLGHEIGDLLLKAMATQLKSCVRASDTVCRHGGDEFMILLDEIKKKDNAAIVAKKILADLKEPFLLKKHEVFVTASIGIAIFPNDGGASGELMKQADTAMYFAKDKGRNNYQFFTSELQDAPQRHLMLEKCIHHAVEKNEIYLNYQPQFDLITERVTGIEVLSRWHNAKFGEISPTEFIPLVEESGLIEDLTEWITKTAYAQWQKWNLPESKLAINLSVHQIMQPDFPARYLKFLKLMKIEFQHLELEVTETLLMQNPNLCAQKLKKINRAGIKTAIDDYGTGFSSLQYLQLLPINKLKIDLSFIQKIGKDKNSDAIVISTISLAHSLGLKALAEGIETKKQLDFLKKHGCDQGQGYYFSKPLNAKAMENFIKDLS
jgi:diguanylate cyclase (GGDEF)-like protein